MELVSLVIVKLFHLWGCFRLFLQTERLVLRFQNVFHMPFGSLIFPDEFNLQSPYSVSTAEEMFWRAGFLLYRFSLSHVPPTAEWLLKLRPLRLSWRVLLPSCPKPGHSNQAKNTRERKEGTDYRSQKVWFLLNSHWHFNLLIISCPYPSDFVKYNSQCQVSFWIYNT